jgi:hypothetical protein
MKRLLAVAAGAYVAAALFTRYQERVGRMRCDCLADCWCKRAGLSLFRWVFPFRHSLPPEVAEQA